MIAAFMFALFGYTSIMVTNEERRLVLKRDIVKATAYPVSVK